MYKIPGIKTMQVLFMDNKLMYKNPGIKTSEVLIINPTHNTRLVSAWIVSHTYGMSLSKGLYPTAENLDHIAITQNSFVLETGLKKQMASYSITSV